MTEMAATASSSATTEPAAHDPAAATRRLTAWDLLFADSAHPTTDLESALNEHAVLDGARHHVPRWQSVAARFVVAEVSAQILGLLQQLPVGNMLTGGWMHLDKVGEARTATKADGSSRAVSLLNHEISFIHESTVEMLLDESPLQLMELAVNAHFAIEGCELVITNGEVVRAHPGPTAAKATLQANGVTLVEHEVAKVDPSRLFDNGAGAEHDQSKSVGHTD